MNSDPREKVWVWTYNSDEAGEPAVRYPMEAEEPIRVRVRAVHFSHLKQGAEGGPAGAVGGPGAGMVVKGTQALDAAAAEAGLLLAGARRPRSDTLTGGLLDEGGPPPPMQIVATTNEDGLGMIAWWG